KTKLCSDLPSSSAVARLPGMPTLPPGGRHRKGEECCRPRERTRRKTELRSEGKELRRPGTSPSVSEGCSRSAPARREGARRSLELQESRLRSSNRAVRRGPGFASWPACPV